jgi:hypothetical protein
VGTLAGNRHESRDEEGRCRHGEPEVKARRGGFGGYKLQDQKGFPFRGEAWWSSVDLC